MELPIDSIVIGARARKDLGDLDSLADSIRESGGPLHPPVVRQSGTLYILVCGARRIAAMRKLGYDRVEVRVAATLTDELAALRAERDENTCRKDFTPSEAVAAARQIETVEAKLAKDRQRAGKKIAGPSPDSGEGRHDRETATRVAKAVGVGRTKLTEAKSVVDAAEDGSLPEPVRAVAKEAQTEMDRTGNAHAAAKAVEAAKAAAVAGRPVETRDQREAEQRARDTTEAFARTVTRIADILDFPDADASARLLVDSWRPDAVPRVCPSELLSAEGFRRIASLLSRFADHWEDLRG